MDGRSAPELAISPTAVADDEGMAGHRSRGCGFVNRQQELIPPVMVGVSQCKIANLPFREAAPDGPPLLEDLHRLSLTPDDLRDSISASLLAHAAYNSLGALF